MTDHEIHLTIVVRTDESAEDSQDRLIDALLDVHNDADFCLTIFGDGRLAGEATPPPTRQRSITYHHNDRPGVPLVPAGADHKYSPDYWIRADGYDVGYVLANRAGRSGGSIGSFTAFLLDGTRIAPPSVFYRDMKLDVAAHFIDGVEPR